MYFNALPQSWKEAPHFGNALLGSMLYLRDGKLCLEIFRADVRDHRDDTHGWTAYSRPRFRVGYFTLETAGKQIGCRWRKDLWNAELTGVITTDGDEIGIRHFVHAEDMVIVTELTGEPGMRWEWHPFPASTSRDGYPTNPEELDAFAKRYGEHYRQSLQPLTPNPPGRLERVGEVSVWIQDLLAGGQYATAWTERGGALIVSIAHSCREACAAVERSPQIESHRAWWHECYRRSFVTIPDKSLEALYWQTIYRYGCNSRTGRFYVDTPGLWLQGGPWPYTTNDWNTQSAHWGVYAANRLEQGAEVVNRLHANRENLIAAVEPDEWRADSAFLHLATASDMAGRRSSDRRYYDCVGCLPWLLHNAWWQYRYSMDDALLREKIYPLLRRAINLYFHLAQTGADGRIHLPPTYSPETGVWRNCNFDLALFKWGCHVLLKAARRLGIDDPLIPRWREVIEKLFEFPADEKGFKLGSEETARDKHRHFSHLLMIYPLYLVNSEQPGTAEVLRRSCDLAYRSVGSDGSAELGVLHAMVQTHAGPIAAALGDGDRALAGLKLLQSELTPNGLWGCAGNPCLEASLAVANNIQNMLLQSWSDPAADEPGPIRVFPAVPAAWADVEFHNLRAEGAFLVSAKRSRGRTQWVRIQSRAGEPCRVRPGLDGKIVLQADHPLRIQEVAPGIYEIDLRTGEQVILRGSGQSLPNE